MFRRGLKDSLFLIIAPHEIIEVTNLGVKRDGEIVVVHDEDPLEPQFGVFFFRREFIGVRARSADTTRDRKTLHLVTLGRLDDQIVNFPMAVGKVNSVPTTRSLKGLLRARLKDGNRKQQPIAGLSGKVRDGYVKYGMDRPVRSLPAVGGG